MSSYGYGFCPQSPSYTAMKYMRTYIPHRALLPGERYRLHLDMEAKVGKLLYISKSKISRENIWQFNDFLTLLLFIKGSWI